MSDPSAWTFPGCPQPPHWKLDWEDVVRAYPWLQEMNGVPQDRHFHGEGDVLIHTRMVAESMVGLSWWRAQTATVRQALFAAALLHDIGKAQTTREEPDGRITSQHHAARSEIRCRQLLWLGRGHRGEAPFEIRERICALVREHGLPLWFLDKQSPQRRILQAGLRLDLGHLAMLAESDVHGRICAEHEELARRVELFRDYALELGCGNGAAPFASPHSRFVYFQSDKPDADPRYHAFDDTEFEVVILCGLPGSGKDTWISKNLRGWPVVSLDALRRQAGVSPEDAQGGIVQAAREQARNFLRAKTPFAWNATNLTRLTRGPLIRMCAGYGARVRLIYVEAPLNVIWERNRSRPAVVPSKVMERLLTRLQIPALDEAHHVEWHVQKVVLHRPS